tara:strand:- start:4553 stop:6163 length:1611 start_codon:yes stop_codon:yes gene_type:complete
MSDPYASRTVPFTNVASDYQKLAAIPDSLKENYIDYASSDFITLRNALLAYMESVYPTDYNNFAESDLGMMLVELIAYMGSVMSLKSDMLANENFLSTSKNINSVRKLFDLVGISLKGPTSAQAAVDISVDNITSLDNTLVLSPSERVVSVIAPQDGEALTYTVYRVEDGKVDNINNTASVSFTSSVDSSSTGTYSDAVLLEGAFGVQSGTFSDIGIFKEISLDDKPVIQNSVEVLVTSTNTSANGVYRQVDNIFQASSLEDRVFQVVYSDDYSARIIFGDGSNGIAPPPQSQYTVTYRVGGGTRGNTPNSYVNAVGTGTYGAASTGIRFSQTTLATGGADAESIDHAKRYGPLYFRTQDRIVSLDDYIAFANSFTSPVGTTGKATAVTRKAYSSANIIDLYLLEKASNNQYQKASLSFKDALLTQLESKKMLTDEVVLVDGLIRTLDLIVSINISKRFEGTEGVITSRVSDRVLKYFMNDNWNFGDPLVVADLNREIFETDDVLFSSIDNLDGTIHVEFNEIIQLNNIDISVNLI